MKASDSPEAQAVYAVAIGERLGLGQAELKRLAVGDIDGDRTLSALFVFVRDLAKRDLLGEVPTAAQAAELRDAGHSDDFIRAFVNVAPVIQPLHIDAT